MLFDKHNGIELKLFADKNPLKQLEEEQQLHGTVKRCNKLYEFTVYESGKIHGLDPELEQHVKARMLSIQLEHALSSEPESVH